MSSRKRRPFCLGLNVLNTAHLQLMPIAPMGYTAYGLQPFGSHHECFLTRTPHPSYWWRQHCAWHPLILDSTEKAIATTWREVIWFLNVIMPYFKSMSWQQEKWRYKCDFFPSNLAKQPIWHVTRTPVFINCSIALNDITIIYKTFTWNSGLVEMCCACGRLLVYLQAIKGGLHCIW